MKIPHYRILAVLILSISFCTLAQRLYSQPGRHAFLNSELGDYSKTDFSKIDSPSCWFYVLMDKNLSYVDSIKPVGQLIFQRTHEINDSISFRLYKRGFLPVYTFQIFDIKDSAYCFSKSRLVRTFSSCVSPDVGGDIIILGKFIFLNDNVCVGCKRYVDGLDYCRPLINKLFLGVDKTKANTPEEIVKQFPIKGQVMKLPF